MRKIACTIICIAIILSANIVAYATGETSELKRIDITIDIDTNGTAHIQEVWNAEVWNGSEASRTLLNLSGSEVLDFTVHDETGRLYKDIKQWDSSKPRITKYTSNGTQQRMNGDVVLYWGLGDYGTRAYILEYKVTNFVRNSADGIQFSYFTFVAPGTRPTPQFININLSLNTAGMNVKAEELHRYGLEGNLSVDNDLRIININTENCNLTYENYAIGIVKYSGDTFNTTRSSNKTFTEIVTEADAGQGLGVTIVPRTLKDILPDILKVLAIILIVVFIVDKYKVHKRLKNDSGLPVKIINDPALKNIRKAYVKEFNSTIPFNGDILATYNLAQQYNILNNRYTIFGAILLKWVLAKHININYKNSNNIEIDLIAEPTDNDREKELYTMLVDSSHDNILTLKELEKWFRDNYESLLNWINTITEVESEKLLEAGILKLHPQTKRIAKLIKFKECEETEQAIKLMHQIQGYKKFLKEFSKHQPQSEDNISEQMVYAQLLSTTNVFIEQLQTIFGEEAEIENFTNKEIKKLIMGINSINSLMAMRVETSRKSDNMQKRIQNRRKELGLKSKKQDSN